MISYFTFGLALMRAASTMAAIPSVLPPIHYTISRRSGSFPAPDTANLTYLLEELKVVETRFNATTRDFNGNMVVRKPKRIRGTQGNTILLGEVGREGNWFADLKMGEPAQTVDMDLDMLTADWWVLSTSSSKGSWFLDFNSKTYGLFTLLYCTADMANENKLIQKHLFLFQHVEDQPMSCTYPLFRDQFLFPSRIADLPNSGFVLCYLLEHISVLLHRLR